METEIAARGKNDIIIKKQGDMLKESPKRATPTIILQKN
jgi:hypothetical protein